MVTKYPLLVQFEYFTGSLEAANTAKWLHAKFNEDPAVPGIRIPTCFTPDNGSLEPPEPLIADEAERVVVVLLADDHLVANARKPLEGRLTWAEYVVRLRRLCEKSPDIYRFMPVQLTEHGWPIDDRLSDLNVLQAWATEGDGRAKLISRRLANLLIRLLRQHLDGKSNESDVETLHPMTVFLSHARVDLDSEPQVVRSLLAHLNATQPEKTWFDSGDITTGSRFKDEIDRGVKDAALLAILTDSYSSRSWCRREVLLAKQYQRPVVVVNAVQQREVRSFPYAGNAPVIRWNKDPQDVVDLLLMETLRHVYAQESLRQRARPGDDVLPGSPELLTIVDRKCQAVLYPDPPLGLEELAVLSRARVPVETPLERHAKENNLRDRSLIIALSVSEAEDLSRFGMSKSHFDSIFLELSRYLLIAGIRLAYGGHLRAGGYTVRLADLLRDPIVEQLCGESHSEVARPAELIVYLPWPTLTTERDQARLGHLVEVRRCDRPEDISEKLDPAFVAFPTAALNADTAVHRYGWSRGLSVMRSRQTAEVSARIVVGGRLGPTKEGYYMGRMPGVLEEALMSIRTKRPIYLIGAFGGCARLVVDALEGVVRKELTWEYQSGAAYSSELRTMYQERGQEWDEYDEISSFLRECSYGGLHNGLTTEQNSELAKTRSAERIIELVFTGLSRVTS